MKKETHEFEQKMTTRGLFVKAARTIDPSEFKKIALDIVFRVGEKDENGLYYIDPQYQTKTSQALKPPSPEYPDNYFAHVQTRKYIEAYLNQLQIKFLSGNLSITNAQLKTTERKLKAFTN